MADYKVTDSDMTSVANAIRTKGGTQGLLEWPSGFRTAIENIPSGGTSDNWNIPLIRNWDFSNPIRTHGSASSWTSGIPFNGWEIVGSNTNVEIVSGGFYIYKRAVGDNTNLYTKSANNSYCDVENLLNKKLTISLFANNKLATQTFDFSSATGNKASVAVDGITFWFNRDSSSEFACGFASDLLAGTTLVQAVKVEVGEVQTLCKNTDSTPVLIRNQNQEEELFFHKTIASYLWQ